MSAPVIRAATRKQAAAEQRATGRTVITTGQLLRRARRAMGLSEARFAARIGTSPSLVHAWECDTRNLSVPRLIKVAAALGVPPETLLPTAERKPTLAEAQMHLAAAQHILAQLGRDA